MEARDECRTAGQNLFSINSHEEFMSVVSIYLKITNVMEQAVMYIGLNVSVLLSCTSHGFLFGYFCRLGFLAYVSLGLINIDVHIVAIILIKNRIYLLTIFQYDQAKWDDDSPLAVTMWKMSGQFVDMSWEIKWLDPPNAYTSSKFKFSPGLKKADRGKSCSALYIVNIYEFSWLRIPCYVPFHMRHLESGSLSSLGASFTVGFICEHWENTSSLVDVQKSLSYFCPDNPVVFLNYCLKFHNEDYRRDRLSDLHVDMQSVLDASHQRIVLLDMFMREDHFHVLLTKFFKRNSVLLFVQRCETNRKPVGLGTAKLFKTKKVRSHKIHNWIYTNVSSNQFEEILCISQVEKRNTQCPKGSFQCGDKSCITSFLLCDNILHCSDGTDEENITCSLLKSFSAVVYLLKLSTASTTTENILKNTTTPLKFDTFDIPCEATDNILTYPAHKTCVFDRTYQECKGISFSWILQFCKVHQCLHHVKCPDSYCVPYRTICDGVYDCPNGEDEYNCTFLNCSGMSAKHALYFRTLRTTFSSIQE